MFSSLPPWHSGPDSAPARCSAPASICCLPVESSRRRVSPRTRRAPSATTTSIWDATPHADLACLDCHPGFDADPHPEALPAKPYAVCADCHDAGEKLQSSVHGAPGKATPSCRECHGVAHKIVAVKDPASLASPGHVTATCAQCHQEEAKKRGDRRPCRSCRATAPMPPASIATASRTRSSQGDRGAHRLQQLPCDRGDRAAREPARQSGGARGRARADLSHLPRWSRDPLPPRSEVAGRGDEYSPPVRRVPPRRQRGFADPRHPAGKHPRELRRLDPRRGFVQEGTDGHRGLHLLPFRPQHPAAHRSRSRRSTCATSSRPAPSATGRSKSCTAR